VVDELARFSRAERWVHRTTAVLVGRNEDAVKKLQARGLASLRRGIECLSGCWRVDLEHAS